MVELGSGIIAVIVLGSVLVSLLLLFALTTVLLLRKKRLFCFKRQAYTRPFLQTDRNYGKHYGHKKKKKGRLLQEANRKGATTGNKSNPTGYQSFSKALRFPKRDPFANSYLENPMLDMEELDTDWTNPAFDRSRAERFDAVITIQSWYRMIRYKAVIPCRRIVYFQ